MLTSAQGCLPGPGNTFPGPGRISRRQRCSTFGFTSNARATSPIELPRSSRCTAASLNSLVNILLDNPMTQFSFGWILSLNWLCQKWGQVHLAPGARLYGRERLPKLGKTLDGFSLVDELACVLLDIVGELLLGLVLRHCGGAPRFLLPSSKCRARRVPH